MWEELDMIYKRMFYFDKEDVRHIVLLSSSEAIIFRMEFLGKK
jgi:hypothetical protein